MTGMATFRMLVLVAFRNLFAHWVKTLFVGSIIAFGTLLLVTGTALTSSIDRAMADGVTGSLGGHLQVYSAKGKDELALFGGMFMGAEDIGRIDDYSVLRDRVEAIDGVKAVLPMGIDMATATSPGELEQALAELRTAVRDEDAEAIPGLKARIREILSKVGDELTKNAKITADAARIEEGLAIVERATSDELWSRFDEAPMEVLEYLDTKAAPFTEEGRMMYFRYVGTDLEMFPKYFDRFEVVKGEVVPPGHRGFMFNSKFYEDWVKHFVARNFDKLQSAVVAKGQRIEDDASLQARVRQMSKQYKRITYQLTPSEADALKSELTSFLGEEGALDALLEKFLAVDDTNLAERYAFFYEKIVPKIDLYDFDVGDTITLRAFTRSGFLKSVNVKIYGVFQFRGLETSDIAGGHNLVDLLTFRELYGLMTADKKKELSGIRDEIGLEDVSAADAEDALFGGDDEPVEQTVQRTEGFDEFEGIDLATERERMEAVANATFSKAQQDKGLALNAAVILDDPEQLEAVRPVLEKTLEDAGSSMKVVDWRAASGIVGQFITVVWGLLFSAIFIIFLVALVIINNSMVMATMERVTEIGTMRAIGAQRSTVLFMFLLETMVLGTLAGLVGILLGGGLIEWLGSVGIPAPNDELTFMFGGPRLYPSLGVVSLVFAFVVVFFVSLLSTIIPAFMATRIQPIMAMRAKE